MGTTVSIVVPAFNNAEYIERTMESILAQTHRDLEIIVGDHSSTDDTWSLLQQYRDDPRVTLLRTEAGGGARANWNRVSKAATGKYLKLVCGDDLIYPDSVAVQLRALEANTGASLTASTRDIIDASDSPVMRGRGLSGLRGLVPGRKAVRRTVTAGANIFGEPGCVMMKRDALEQRAGGTPPFPISLTKPPTRVCSSRGDFVAIHRSLAGFRLSDSSGASASPSRRASRPQPSTAGSSRPTGGHFSC